MRIRVPNKNRTKDLHPDKLALEEGVRPQGPTSLEWVRRIIDATGNKRVQVKTDILSVGGYTP